MNLAGLGAPGAERLAPLDGAGSYRDLSADFGLAPPDIPLGPGKTSLAKGGLITSIFSPSRPQDASDAYLRFIPRTEMDIAVSSAGVNLELDNNGACTAARVAVGASADRSK